MLHFITWSDLNRIIIILMLLFYLAVIGLYYRKDILVRIRRLIRKT